MDSDNVNKTIDKLKAKIAFWFKQSENDGLEKRKNLIEKIAKVLFIPVVAGSIGVGFFFSKAGNQLGLKRTVPQDYSENKVPGASRGYSESKGLSPFHVDKTQKNVPTLIAANKKIEETRTIEKTQPVEHLTDDSPLDQDLLNNNSESENISKLVELEIAPITTAKEPKILSAQKTALPMPKKLTLESLAVEITPENDITSTSLEGIKEEVVAALLNASGKINFPAIFPVGSSNMALLKEANFKDLNKLQKECQSTIQVIGHSDNTGSVQTNEYLGMKRANEVKSLLISRGFNESLLEISTRGASEPIADNSTDQGRLSNRRVTLECSQ
jgi:outer membrane protein OmpA-like peptidoglycan-associated protein